ncbi:cation transporting ATPase C-terminal domain-containing protein [Nonomuraea lactucae]|uniref:cation transporting ATPase C-terminal domain-containing protein n=1 Tax=Nonomuraea lactucae TaxID=2249762 RepID=UPI001F05B0CD|nr:cation transporting ATPase C-terminal domain-containing protein [Nonomuraea lactucae]
MYAPPGLSDADAARLLAGNLAEIFLVLVGLFAWPDLVIPLLPVQLLWINLVLDGIPAIALGVDKAPGDPSPPGPPATGCCRAGCWAASRSGR